MNESKKSKIEPSMDKDEKSPSLESVLNNKMGGGLEHSLETLSTAFTASARRWEAIVYPSLFAFILLAAYGFYLIYNLTSDVRRVADHMEEIVTSMSDISVNMRVMSNNMVVMTQTLDTQSASMREMTFYMGNINQSMVRMRYDLAVMNNSVSRPMNFMNTFLPW